jgi:hypothetical protein
MKAALLIQYVQNSYSEYVVPFLFFAKTSYFNMEDDDQSAHSYHFHNEHPIKY